MIPGFTVIVRDGEAGFASNGSTSERGSPLVIPAQALGLTAVFMGRLYYRGDWLPRLVDRLPASLIDRCRTNDAALALVAYRLSGLEGIARLEGDFALAIWDSGSGCLIGARDPMGGYPLFWTDRAGSFALSTGTAPLLDLLSTRSLDLDYIADFLMLPGQLQELGGERSVYQGIHRVEAGTAVSRNGPTGRVERSVLWDWAERIEDPGTESLDEVAEGYGDRLRTAVRERVRGRVAVHLSGGMDSTSVALLADERIGQGYGTGPLQTISLVHESIAGLDVENPYIELGLSRLRNAQAHQVPADDLLDFDGFVDPPPHDEPYAGLRRISLDAATIEAADRCGAETLLTGIGADEMLVMSPWHATDLLRRGRLVKAWSEIRHWARVDNCSPWTLFYPHALANLLPAWSRVGLRAALKGGRADWRRQNEWTIAPWITPGFARRYRLRHRSIEAARRTFDTSRPMALSLALHMIRSRLGDVDRWSLATPRGMTIAHPYLDSRVLRYGLGMQLRLRPQPEGQKPVLARAMRDVLPDEIINRRRKCDFSKVAYLGLARNLPALEEMVRVSPVDELGMIDKSQLINCLNQSALGVASGVDGMHRLNVTLALFRWLMLQGRNNHAASVAAPACNFPAESAPVLRS